MLKVSFDYDSCLSKPYVQLLAERHLYFKDDVYIVTSRKSKIIDIKGRNIGNILNEDIYEIADELGIKKENIYFTESQNKIKKLLELGIQLHYDDDQIEINEILKYEDLINAIKIP